MTVTAPDCNYGTADAPAKLKSIEAVDQFTVKFTLCAPDPAFASKVAFSVFGITSKANLDKTAGDSVQMSNQPEGTGPYILKEWVRGDHITFEANPNYWGTAPKAKTLIYRWAEQPSQRLLELQSGTVDGIDNPAPEDYATITADTNLKLYNRAPLNIFYVGITNTFKPFDNEKVRQALAMALDRKRIVDNFYPTGSTVADQFMPEPIKPGFTAGATWYNFDAAAAKKALADAGFPNGFKTTLAYRNVSRPYLPNPKQVAQEIQAEMANIGVTVTLKEMESATFLSDTAAGKEPFYLLGWNADYPDATDFVDYHFANANNKQFGTPFPDLVTEINAAAQLSDPAARQQHYDKVNELIKQHVPMIPVANGVSATVFKAAVQGAHASPLGNEFMGVMSAPQNDTLVWLQSGEPAALWCSDETDGETLRACEQIFDALLSYKVGGVEVQAGLADKWEANTDATEWTFHLRNNVKFFSGKLLDANDVVATYDALWDASSPDHKGRTGQFEYFGTFFGAFLNAKK
jgi:peptide/nickel transport system substrate-binding protein